VTLAGRLQDMFRNVVAVGSDVYPESAVASPSLLIDDMSLGGD